LSLFKVPPPFIIHYWKHCRVRVLCRRGAAGQRKLHMRSSRSTVSGARSRDTFHSRPRWKCDILRFYYTPDVACRIKNG